MCVRTTFWAFAAAVLFSLPLLHADTKIAPVTILNPDFKDGLQHWSESRPPDATFSAADGAVMLKLGKPGFCRIYQDVPVQPNTTYRLSYQGKVDVVGSMGRSWVILHSTDDKAWRENRIVYSPYSQKIQWEPCSYFFTTMPDTDMVRLNLGPRGEGATVFFTGIKIEPISQHQTVQVPAIREPITLDGRLDDPAWTKAVVLEDFRVLGEPMQSAKVQTHARMLIRGDDLYIAFRADEPRMENLVDKSRTASIGLYADDSAQIFITAGGAANYQFVINPTGLHYVAERGAAQSRRTWHLPSATVFSDTDWDAAASRSAQEWSLEIRISLSKLLTDAPAGSHILYANVCRHRPQEDPVHSNWAGMVGETFLDPSQYRPLALDWKPAPVAGEAPAMAVRDLPLTASWGSPDLLMAGKPLHMEIGSGRCPLPTALRIHEADFQMDPSLGEFIAKGVQLSTGQAAWDVRCQRWPRSQAWAGVTPEQARLLQTSPEAFGLEITPGGVTLRAHANDGIYRGLATLALLASYAKNNGHSDLPALSILDAPQIPVRGWLVATGSPQDIKRHIDILYLLRYNTIMFGVSGFGKDAIFPFDSHPNIGGKSSTKAQWAELADYARSRGINPVPEFYCFARAGFILNKPEYKHLAVNPDLPHGVLVKSAHNKNFSSSNPQTYALIFDLMQELIDTMKLTDLQIGQDEVHYDALNTDPASVADHVTRTDWLVRTSTRAHAFLASKQVRMWMYADCLDPDQNGKAFEISGKEVLAKLPRDIIMQDWKYDGLSYPSFQLFAGNGFRTVGSPWYWPWNVAGTARDIAALPQNGYGFVGTSWSGTTPSKVLSELVAAQSLGAYASWSPIPDAGQVPYVPSQLYQAAAYHYGQESAPVRSQTPVEAPQGVVVGTGLAQALGFAGHEQLTFLKQPLTTANGVKLIPFTQNKQPAGLLVKGKSQESHTIPLVGKVSRLTLLHAENRQLFEEKYTGAIGALPSQYAGVTPAAYVVHYADGATSRLALVQRRTSNAWNDRFQAAQAQPGIFGTVGNLHHVNIPVLTWVNPSPEKELQSLELVAGNRQDMDIVLLALTREP